jgi:Lar family restriction alleviation protein
MKKVTFEAEVEPSFSYSRPGAFMRIYAHGGEHFIVPNDLEAGRYRVTLEPLPPALKPCPFCGGKAKMAHELPRPADQKIEAWWVMCYRCLAKTDGFGTELLATEAWNRRAEEAP